LITCQKAGVSLEALSEGTTEKEQQGLTCRESRSNRWQASAHDLGARSWDDLQPLVVLIKLSQVLGVSERERDTGESECVCV
jgi:hypothetical protein